MGVVCGRLAIAWMLRAEKRNLGLDRGSCSWSPWLLLGASPWPTAVPVLSMLLLAFISAALATSFALLRQLPLLHLLCASQFFEIFYMLISPFLFTLLYRFVVFSCLYFYLAGFWEGQGEEWSHCLQGFILTRETHTQLLRLSLCIEIIDLAFLPKHVSLG